MIDMKKLDQLWWNTLTPERKAELIMSDKPKISEMPDYRNSDGYRQKLELFGTILADIAPCLVAGHEPDGTVQFKFEPDCPNPYRLNRFDHPTYIQLNLCARCGVVYEEKKK